MSKSHDPVLLEGLVATTALAKSVTPDPSCEDMDVLLK